METGKFVAFFDILGYKEIVQNLSINELKDLMEKLLNLIKRYIFYAELTYDDNKIDYVIFSDSIVFYSKDLSDISFKSICLISNSFLFFSLLEGMPVRGSISHGEFYIDKEKNIFFGKALVRAYETEGKQKWSGACICHETIKYINENYTDMISSLEKNKFIFQYDVPVSFAKMEEVFDEKNEEIIAHEFYEVKKERFYVLNWCILNRFIPKEQKYNEINVKSFYPYFLRSEVFKSIKNDEEKTYKDLFNNLHESVKFKIINTKKFFEDSQNIRN